MVVARDDQVPLEVGVRIGMAMDIADAVNDCPFAGKYLAGAEEFLKAGVMVPRKDNQGDECPELFKEPGNFFLFLPAQEGHAVFHITEENKHVWFNRADAASETVNSLPAVTPDMDAAAGEKLLYSQVKVSRNKDLLGMIHEERRSIGNEFKFHRAL